MQLKLAATVFCLFHLITSSNVRIENSKFNPICKDDTDCRTGYFCMDSKCNDRCMLMRCTSGSCKDGVCGSAPTDPIVTDPIVTDPPQQLEQIKCEDPRPNEQNCPTLYWIRLPDPVVCGVDQKGNYVDFPVECYACKQKDIVFYYNATCAKVPKYNQALSCAAVSCPFGKECKDGKCIEPVSSAKIVCPITRPTQKQCPTLTFIREPDPLVCGVSKTGQLINFPVECYACKNTSVIYYYNTTCDKIDSMLCATVRCKQGFRCFGGQCLPIKWPVCQDCTKVTRCNKTRPDNSTCPVIYFFAPPKNIVCGITKTGQRISYPVECYACKNPDVIFYYNQSCEYLSSPCPVPTDPIQTDPIQCLTDRTCPIGFSCQSNVCVDKCILTTCPRGTDCVKGNCVWSHLQPRDCSTVRCRKGFRCVGGQCINNCKDIFCIATTTCIDGKCVPLSVNTDSCATIRCRKGFKCENGKCVDACKDIFCIATTSCIDGVCVPIPVDDSSCAAVQCIQGEKCQNGKCVDSCKDIFCIATHRCVNGECVPIPIEQEPQDCSLILCRPGTKCVDGKCVDRCQDIFCIATTTCIDGECVPLPQNTNLCVDVTCEKGFKCQYGKCVDACQDVFCIGTHTCVDGECVPAFY